jgi:zinc protease
MALVPTRVRLPNGAVVIALGTPKLPAVSVNLAIRAGSIADPADLPGATHLLGRVIDRGTLARSAAVIADELDDRGVSLNVVVTRHLFSIDCTCLREDFDHVLSLLADIVMCPSIPESELTVRKGEVVTAIRQDEDNPAVRAVEELMALLYMEPHPYGRRAKGTIESVERTTRNVLLRLHREGFAPGALTAVVVGDLAASRAVDAATDCFGSWRGSETLPRASPLEAAGVAGPHAKAPDARRQTVIPMMNKAQTDIAYGFRTIPRSDPSYYAFVLMNNVLGQYALGGRLGDSIRERQGMAYYVSSSFDANVLEGPLVIHVGVNAANVRRTIDSIDHELELIGRDGVTAKELDASRRYLTGSMPRALETNAGIARFLQTAEFFGLGLDHDQRLPELLGRVTLADVHAAARTLDPARATIVIAGPYGGSGTGE